MVPQQEQGTAKLLWQSLQQCFGIQAVCYFVSLRRRTQRSSTAPMELPALREAGVGNTLSLDLRERICQFLKGLLLKHCRRAGTEGLLRVKRRERGNLLWEMCNSVNGEARGIANERPLHPWGEHTLPGASQDRSLREPLESAPNAWRTGFRHLCQMQLENVWVSEQNTTF